MSLQLPDMQQSMASSFEILMKDIARSLSAKNRDKYANILVHTGKSYVVTGLHKIFQCSEETCGVV